MSKTITFKYTAEVDLELEHTQDSKTSSHQHNEVRPICPKGSWKDKDGYPTAEGVKATTVALICGLSNQIHYAHQSNMWDSAEHLRYIISKLEEQFVLDAKVEKIDNSKS